MSRSTSPCNPSRCGSQTRAPKTNRDTTFWASEEFRIAHSSRRHDPCYARTSRLAACSFFKLAFDLASI